jgi:hypothetical protein
MLATARTPHSALAVNLCLHVLEEAKSPAGTWTLATHGKITSALFRLSSEDVKLFMTSVVQRLIAEDASSSERYKLAQICTMCRNKRSPAIDAVLLRYQQQITNLMETLDTDCLAPAITKLLASLYAERPRGRQSLIVCSPVSTVVSRKIAVSRTPGK